MINLKPVHTPCLKSYRMSYDTNALYKKQTNTVVEALLAFLEESTLSDPGTCSYTTLYCSLYV